MKKLYCYECGRFAGFLVKDIESRISPKAKMWQSSGILCSNPECPKSWLRTRGHLDYRKCRVNREEYVCAEDLTEEMYDKIRKEEYDPIFEELCIEEVIVRDGKVYGLREVDESGRVVDHGERGHS